MAYWYKSGHDWYWNPQPDTQPATLFGYSYEAITDPDQKPPDYEPPAPPEAEVPADVSIPTLTLQPGWPPPLTGELPNTGGEGDANPPPPGSPFHILPSSLREAQDTILTPVAAGVNDWDELKADVDRVKHFIFYRPENVSEDQHSPPSEDALDMVSYLDNALLAGADALTLAGTFVRYLNEAGQIYVHADKESEFPLE